MQKLVFINGAGETIDLTSGDFGITEWEGFSGADLNIQSQQVPFQDGAVFLDALIEQRELSVTVAMNAKGDLDKRYRLRRQMISILNPKHGEGLLIYTDNYLSKQIHVIPQIPLFETNNSNDAGTPKVSCSFTACNPYWEDLEEISVFISGLNTVVNNGDVPAQVEIIIPAGSINPSIANRRNQKQIKLQGTYDDSVDINTNLGSKSVKSELTEFKWVAGGDFNDMAFGVNKYVYIGSHLVVEDYLSGEVKAFTLEFLRSQNYLMNRIIYAGGKFVIVGNHGSIFTSSDGVDWYGQLFAFTMLKDLYDVIYANNEYVYVGADGTIIKGVTLEYSGVSVALKGVEFGNNLYVVVGNSGTILTSSDGTNWTLRTSGVNTNLNDLLYNNNLYVAVGNSGTILTSSDGTTWTSQTSGYTNNLKRICFDNDLYIAVGEGGTILTSPDAITWTKRTSGVNTALNSVKQYNNLFYAVGNSGLVLTSNEGINWTGNVIIGDSLNTIGFGNNLYVAGGTNGTILTSPDGRNWTKRPIGGISNYTIGGVVFGNNLYIAVAVIPYGINYYILTSSDGITWTTKYISSLVGSLVDVIFENNLFVAVGDNGDIHTSSDGITWTRRTSGTSVALSKTTFGNNLYVVVGNSGTILTSTDAVTWTSRTSGSSNTLYGVAFGNDLFVAVGTGGTILTSTDGINWTSRTSGVEKDIYDITFGNDVFIATGENGLVLISTDGINWTDRNSGIVDALYEIAFGNDLFVAVGENGIILNSYVSQTLNLISDLSQDSDMTFNLEIGNNDILYSTENNKSATLKYRQRYIGV